MDVVLPLAYIALAVLTLVMAPEAVTLFRVGTAFSRAHLLFTCAESRFYGRQ